MFQRAGRRRRRRARQPARRPAGEARPRPTRTLKDANPRIVCAHLSAYGREGSRKAWPGYDYLMQAEAGHMSLTGEPDGPPTRYGLSIVDLMTGLAAAFGLLAGVHRARARPARHGRRHLALRRGAAQPQLSRHLVPERAARSPARTPRSAHPSLTPSQLYRTQDGWIFIMCNKEKFWPLLAEALGQPEWIDDPELRHLQGAPRQSRARHADARRRADEAHHRGMDRALRRQGAGAPVLRRGAGAAKTTSSPSATAWSTTAIRTAAARA